MDVCGDCQGLNRHRFEDLKNRYLETSFRVFHCEIIDYFNSPRRVACDKFKPRRPAF